MQRDEILDTAKTLINVDRAAAYGPAKETFERIAAGWNVIAQEAMRTDGRITVAHVALMMDWLKTARLLNSMKHDDSWIDKAAYSALGGELASDV